MSVQQATRHEPVRDVANAPVQMVLAPLRDVPVFELPCGCRVRWFEPGDADTWARIHTECEGYDPLPDDLFSRDFGTDERVLHDRVCFVRDADGKDVATAAAWFNDYKGAPYGRLHWVATARAAQGKGLGKGLVSAAMERLRGLGHDRAYLTTNTVRLRAIALYNRFGFVPQVDSDADAKAWEEVRRALAKVGRVLAYS